MEMVLKVASSLLKPPFRYAPMHVSEYILVLNLVLAVILNKDFLKWSF